MPAELLELIKTKELNAKVEQAKREKVLVKQFVTNRDESGCQIDPNEFAQAVLDAGVSHEILLRRGEVYSKRLVMHSRFLASRGAEQLLIEHQQKLERFAAHWAPILEQRDQEARQLNGEKNQLVALINDGASSHRELIDSMGADIAEKVAEIKRQIKLEEANLRELERNAGEHEDGYTASVKNSEINSENGLPRKAEEERLKASWERLQDKRRIISEKQELIASLNQQIADIFINEAVVPENF